MGPSAGVNGGNIVAEGTVDEIKNNENSITGKYLSGKRRLKCLKKGGYPMESGCK